tara:strand:- start:1021 stop:1812 length:792 start_codon:yes stop_codon:yes gene_type:complete
LDFQLKNKVALITGGSRGIGRATALRLADEGTNIAICGRTEESLNQTVSEIKSKGVQAWGLKADVSKIGDIEKFMEITLNKAGHIDVLVNNAVTSSSAPFDTLTDEEFRYHIDVKLMAYIRITRLVFPHMCRIGGGRVINIGGMTARLTAPLRMTNGIVNAGVANFTKQFSAYAAKHNITVNCIHPGYTVTERMKQIFEREAKEGGVEVETILSNHIKDIPLGRLIQPEDIANSVLFFCSPLASMLTGQSIAVDGGASQSVNY